MATSIISVSPDRRSDAPQAAPAPPASGGISFHDVLSALNPLQYMPVVGTIYRAVTGDTIPEGLRLGGSLLLSGLMGGPIGVLTNIAMTIAEKVSGIDPERIAHSIAVGLGLTTDGETQSPAPKPSVAATATATSTPAPGWTTGDLANDGVTFADDGTPTLGNMHGAEALNAVELGRVRSAVAAYARTAALAS